MVWGRPKFLKGGARKDGEGKFFLRRGQRLIGEEVAAREVGDGQRVAVTAVAEDMTNPAAYSAAQAGYIFGGFDFGAGDGVSRVQLEGRK